MHFPPSDARKLLRCGVLAVSSSILMASLPGAGNSAGTATPEPGKPAPIAMPGVGPAPAKTVLGSSVFDWSQRTVQQTKTGERREFFNGPTATLANCRCHVTTLNPGVEAHAAHRHPDEEIVIVQSGTVEVTINGVATRCGAGSVLFFASNDLHHLRNVGDTQASYHVFRIVTAATPPPPAAPTP